MALAVKEVDFGPEGIRCESKLAATKVLWALPTPGVGAAPCSLWVKKVTFRCDISSLSRHFTSLVDKRRLIVQALFIRRSNAWESVFI